jgi:hypothetical protein
VFLSDGPHVGAPEVCAVAHRPTPNEAVARPMGVDTPSAGVIIVE